MSQPGLSSSRTPFLVGALTGVSAAVVVVLILLAVSVLSFGDSTSSTPSAKNSTGTTAVTDASGAKTAIPRPRKLPTPTPATGKCKVAMDAIRVLIRAKASGAVLTEPENTRLNAQLAAMRTDCSPELAQKFFLRELQPWLHYSPTPTPPS